MTALELRLGAAAYPLMLHEAETVRDRLHRSHSVAAQTLAARITEAITADKRRSRSVSLGLDDIAVLRSVLCGTDMGAHDGLRALQAALCTVDDGGGGAEPDAGV